LHRLDGASFLYFFGTLSTAISVFARTNGNRALRHSVAEDFAHIRHGEALTSSASRLTSPGVWPQAMEKSQMINRVPALAAAGLLAAALGAFASAAAATPLSGALAIKNTAPNSIEAIRWGGGGWGGRGWGGGWRGGWRGGGWGWGVGAGIVAGAVVGGALATPYYGYGPYYAAPYYPYYGQVYDAPPPGAYGPQPGAYGPPPGAGAYGPGPGNGADPDYCAHRYRSFDPASGTYTGSDGQHHPCP
jgi:BA14K-like protein